MTSLRARTPLKFGYVFSPADVTDAFDPAEVNEVARTAEEGLFDFVLFDERGASEAPRTEPFTTASYLATRTKHIGLIASASTSYYEPYNLARLIASLDHVTHGRAGWNIVTGASRPVGFNFSQEAVSPETHYSRAAEVIDILRKLWDSWEDGAFIRNKATGEYVDAAKIHAINHEGPLFRIKGPLNVAHSPQGQAVLAHAVPAHDSDLAVDLAVRDADIILLPVQPAVVLRQQADAIRARQGGRAARLFAEFAVEPSNYHLVADHIEALAETAGVDGLTLRFGRPGALAAYVAEVAPELQSRGLLAKEYNGRTLRDRLGLTEPANRYAAA